MMKKTMKNKYKAYLPRTSLLTSLCVRDTKEWAEGLEEYSLTCEKSHTWNGKDTLARTWLQRLKRVNWLRHLSLRMLKSSHTESSVDAWTSYLRDSLASPSARQAFGKELKTRGICSPSSQTELIFADPTRVALENVEGIISCKFGGEQNTSVLKYVLARMEEIGYEGAFTVVSASEEGAPHQRKRVFMLFRNAHPDESERSLGDTEGAGLPSLSSGSGEEQPWRAGTWPARPGQAQHGWEAPRVVMADTEDREDGRDTRVGKEQTESESVISSPRRREDVVDTNDGRGEGNSPDGQPKAEDAQPCSDNGDGYSTIEGCIRQSMGNPIDNGHASSEECRGTSKEQEEGRVQESEGGCSEDRTSESSDNVSNSDSCRTSGGRSSQECGDDRDGLHSDTGERDEVRSEAEGCRGEDGELGNTTSERSCGRSENLLGFQPEMFGEGLETTMGNSPSLRSQQEPRVGSEQQASYTSEESGKAEYSREIEPELGRTANGPSSGYYVTPEEMALRVPRLRLLGNGIVPAQAERAYRILFARFINM